jgi:hypothetical protein
MSAISSGNDGGGPEASAPRLNACTTPGELRRAFSDLCRDLGEVVNVTALCGPDQANTLCVVDFLPGTRPLVAIAERLGGKVFGLSSVAVTLDLPKDFGCPRGFQTPPPACSCTIRR